MATLRFNGSNQYMERNPSGALATIIAGAHTLLVLSRLTATVGFRSCLQFANSTRATSYGGVGLNGTGFLHYDATRGSSLATANPWTSTTDWHMGAIRVNTADNPDVAFSFRNHTTDAAWTHGIAGGSNPGYVAGAPGATGFMQIGRWLTSDWWPGDVAIIAVWAGDLSDAQLNECIVNDRTSDLWNNSFGAPASLLELNVAEASVIDHSGLSTRVAPAAAPTLVGGDPPRWVFDGKGSTGPSITVASSAAAATAAAAATLSRVVPAGSSAAAATAAAARAA